MSLSVLLLSILSGICLLLWGLRTVKRAVLRGYGAQMQMIIAKGTKNRFLSLFSGIGVTMVMQSSVATTLLASSFFGRGMMSLTAGLAIIIGADVGSSVLAKILSYDMSWFAPFLLSVGIIYHLMHDDGSRKRFTARIIMGLGFMLTGLAVIREATAPLASSETLPLILQPLEVEPFLAILVAAIITYVLHSSLSAVLIFATLAAGGVLSIELAIIFVIGANVGISIVPMLAVMKDEPLAVQIPLGNIIMRMIAGLACLLFMNHVSAFISSLPFDTAQQVVLAHMGYNLALVIIFIPTLSLLAKVCERLSPTVESEEDANLRPRYLDQKALTTPSIALSCAVRETLHIAETLQSVLNRSLDALQGKDEGAIQDVRDKDALLDTLFQATKTYLIHLSREEIGDRDADRLMMVMNFATNLENAGDVASKSLMRLANKKFELRHQFSKEGMDEITKIHNRVMDNLKLAQSIFLSSDQKLAKELLGHKRDLKKAEIESTENHMQRLREGMPESMATSGMHMDAIRDLRRINTYITSIAYGVLED